MKFYLIAGLILFVTSCITKNDKKEVTQSDSTPVLIKKAEIAPPNAVDSSQKILNFIAEFVEKDFLRAHKELVDQGKEHNYQFTEIQHLGGMIKYSFEIPDVEGYQEYSCMPSQGETTTLVSGDHDVAKLYFDGLELSKKWDRNDQTSNGRVLELHESWKDYPITTHMLVTYLVYETESILTIKRTFIPK